MRPYSFSFGVGPLGRSAIASLVIMASMASCAQPKSDGEKANDSSSPSPVSSKEFRNPVDIAPPNLCEILPDDALERALGVAGGGELVEDLGDPDSANYSSGELELSCYWEAEDKESGELRNLSIGLVVSPYPYSGYVLPNSHKGKEVEGVGEDARVNIVTDMRWPAIANLYAVEDRYRVNVWYFGVDANEDKSIYDDEELIDMSSYVAREVLDKL